MLCGWCAHCQFLRGYIRAWCFSLPLLLVQILLWSNLTLSVAAAAMERGTLKCDICKGVLQDPKVLPCFHVSCRDCVKILFVRGIKEVTCPVEMCRKSFSCAGRNPESLPDALYVYLKRDVQRLRSRTISGDAVCSLCMNAGKGECRAEYFCDLCCYICAECNQKHTSDPTYSEHGVSSFIDITNQRDHVLSEKLKRSRAMSASDGCKNSCEVHPGIAKQSYCLDCGVAVCPECIETSHSHHKYKATVSAARDCCESIENQLPLVSSLAEEAEEAAVWVKEAVAVVENQKEDLANSIDSSFKQMFKILENRQKELYRKLAGMTDSKLRALKEKGDNFERTAAEMRRRKAFTEELLRTSTDREIFPKFQFLKEVERPQDLENVKSLKVPKLGFKKCMRKEFVDMCTNIDVFSEQASVANCKLIGGEELVGQTMKHSIFDVMVCDHDNKPCSSVQDVRAQIKCSKNSADCSVRVSKRNNIHSVLFCPEFRGKHEVSVTINGTPMKGSPFILNVHASIDRLGYPDMLCIQNVKLGPRGITLAPDNGWVTCQWNGKKIVKYNSFGEFQSEECIGYKNLTGVVLVPSGHLFIVTAEPGCAGVLKCEQNGFIEKVAIYENTDRKSFKNPRGIAVCQKDNIHVCDRDNHQVQIYTSDLNFICALKLGFLKEEKGIVSKEPRPNGIAIDGVNERMVIADVENNFVHVFDRGSHSFSFSRVQGEEMGGPEGVAIDKAGLIYVSENKKHRVSVFQSDGKWLRSLGEKGTGDGELNFPTSIAVDDYGTVYVCDLMNNRIQIF